MLTRFFLPNLRARLVAIIFLALLPAFVLLLTVAGLERSRAMENARLEGTALAGLTKSYYTDVISSTHQMMRWLSLYPELHGNDAGTCSARLAQLFDKLADYRGVSVSHPDGTVLCAAAPEPISGALSSAGQPFFERAKATKSFVVGGFAVGTASKKPNLTFGYPILDSQGGVIAVLGAGLDIESLARRLSNSQFYEHVALLLVDADGTVVLRHPDVEQYVGRNVGDLELFQEAVRNKEGNAVLPGVANVTRVWSFTTIGDREKPELYVFAGITEAYVLEGVNRMLRSSMLGLTVIGLVALVAAWLSAEVMIVRRTQRVVTAAERMRSGDLSARVGLTDDASEVGQLAQTFDQMAAALEQREADNRELLEQMTRLNAELETRVVKRTEQLQISNSRLLDSQAELRRLSAELMRVTELERSRISREIHDQLGQLLTAIKMELRNIDKEAGDALPPVRSRVTDTVELVDETIRTVRRISSDLRPGILDDFGLAAAVEWQLQEFGERTGIQWSLDAELNEEQMSRDMATAVFRICQEALTNVTRHAEASQVHVTLSTADGQLEAIIRDNGRGLPPSQEQRPRSLGLVGMRERARHLGGTLEVESPPSGGVLVRVRFPISGGSTARDQSGQAPVG